MRKGYVGFDPTADSLTIGNLVPIMMLANLQRAGHQPVVIAGGGTGLIGDPSGKSAERQMLTREKVAANVESQKRIFSRVLDFSPHISNQAVLMDNAEWLTEISFLDALRDVGKHFSINAMVQRDSVRERLNNREQGISYTEFSYMILQAYDYWYLHRHHGVTLQMGGSDQWGNIVAGAELIAKKGRIEFEDFAISRGYDAQRLETEWEALRHNSEAFGLTAPLVTKADGGKFGKTESGAIWLTAPKPGETSPARTSAFNYYQFWLNAADADVIRFLRIFTFLPGEEIAALEASQQADPGARAAQRALAKAATEILHGPTEAANAESAAKALFSGDIAGLDEQTLAAVFAEVPSSSHSAATLTGEGVVLADLLVETKVVQSKREAREFLQQGGVSVNGRKASPDQRLTTADLLPGRIIALRRGKKQWHVTRWG